MGIRSDVGTFTIVPHWLLSHLYMPEGAERRRRLSPRAIQLYVALGQYTDRDQTAHPGRKLLAKTMGCSVDAVDRAAAELTEAEVLVKTNRRANGRQTSNSYHLRQVQPGQEFQGRENTAQKQGRENAAPPAAKMRPQELEPIELEPSGGTAIAVISPKQTLVAHYVDLVRERAGIEPSKRLIGSMAKRVSELVDQGQPEDSIKAGIEIVVDKSLTAGSLDSAIVQAARQTKSGRRLTPEDVRKRYVTHDD